MNKFLKIEFIPNCYFETFSAKANLASLPKSSRILQEYTQFQIKTDKSLIFYKLNSNLCADFNHND